MAGRYSRIDNRKSSGNGSVITLVVFTALCMVGIWMMTSSTLLPVQDSKVSENNNGVEIEGTENNVESNSNDGDASEVENSNIAAGDNSAPRDEGKQQQFDDSQGDAREVENSNVAVEDNNAPRDEGKQKQFNDSQGDLPEDAIIVDNNERSNHGEKNGDRPEEMEKKAPAEKSDDKANINGEENKQEGSQGVSDNGEEKKVDSEPQAVDSQVWPGETIQNNVEGSEQKSDQNIGKTDVDKQGDQIMPVKVPHKTAGEKVENKADDNEKRSEDNSANKVIDKQQDRVEEKVGNKKDDGEKRAEESQGNADVRTQDDRIDEKMENKKDNNEKTEENSGKPVEEGQEDRVEEKVVNKNDSEKKSLETIDKSDVEKKENPAEHVENNKVEDEKQSDENSSQTNLDAKLDETVEKKKNEEKKDKQPQQGSVEEKDKQNEMLPSGAQSELLKETITQNGSFPTQAAVSENEKEAQKSSVPQNQNNYGWKICKTYTGPDYIPCLDNLAALKKLRTTKHYEHRERHCPENPPTCLVPIHQEYKRPIEWPTSREKIWYHNVPHTKLAEFKGHQNWVKVSGEFLIFPGGGTQFMNGALHYIDYIQQSVPDISWGKRSRVVLDVGCGVASFGGFLFDRDVLTMSMAPKDEHEAQVQFALERGIPAICAVMGTMRLPYPARVFDVVHCARCRVPWHIEGGKLLLEMNRLLRPGGIFMWSATPVYQKLPEDVQIWEEMKKLTKAMCWEVVSIINDKMNGVGIAVFRKPNTNDCYKKRAENSPPLCPDTNDANASWNVPLEACMHKIPVALSERGSKWPEEWPARMEKAPYWLSTTEVGIYGKPAAEDFAIDYKHWKRVVTDTYLNGLGIKWSSVRNVMDMRAVYGGLAAALRKLNVWVLNVVSIDGPDTLPIIFDRGLFGIYHNWCESFNTYPRTYDLLHADHLFSKIKKKCNIMAMVAETDRILRPEGRIIVRDTTETITELESIFKSLQWDVRIIYSKNMQGLIVAQKSMWRPTKEEILTYATV